MRDKVRTENANISHECIKLKEIGDERQIDDRQIDRERNLYKIM